MQFNRSIGPVAVAGDLRAVLAGALLLGLLLNLGFWQLGRASEKAALEARWEARSAIPAVTPAALVADVPAEALADRAVSWQGVFRGDAYLLLDNRLHRGQVGYHVIALAEADGLLVPVNLGWLAGDPSRRTTPRPELPSGTVMIDGRVYVPSAKPIMMQKPVPPDSLPATVQTLYWDNWNDVLTALTGTPVFPYQVRVLSDSPHALLAEWAVVNQAPSKHIGYAVQWFAMAAVLLLIGVFRLTNLKALLGGEERSSL
ncbi:MAG: SURF1 family protein [Luminiphilus sp.]|nr:SURF1 family protein [Luminiphilus sp.]